jgi:hypothetical protein
MGGEAIRQLAHQATKAVLFSRHAMSRVCAFATNPVITPRLITAINIFQHQARVAAMSQ